MQDGHAEGSLQNPTHGLQNGAPQPTSNHTKTRPANSATTKKTERHYSELPMITQHSERESLQKSLQFCNFEGHREVGKRRKSLNLNGGRGRNRTYNLSVKRTINSVISTTYAERLA